MTGDRLFPNEWFHIDVGWMVTRFLAKPVVMNRLKMAEYHAAHFVAYMFLMSGPLRYRAEQLTNYCFIVEQLPLVERAVRLTQRAVAELIPKDQSQTVPDLYYLIILTITSYIAQKWPPGVVTENGDHHLTADQLRVKHSITCEVATVFSGYQQPALAAEYAVKFIQIIEIMGTEA